MVVFFILSLPHKKIRGHGNNYLGEKLRVSFLRGERVGSTGLGVIYAKKKKSLRELMIKGSKVFLATVCEQKDTERNLFIETVITSIKNACLNYDYCRFRGCSVAEWLGR